MFFSPFKITLLAAWTLYMFYFVDGGVLISGIGWCVYIGIAFIYHLLKGSDFSWALGMIAAFGILILVLNFVPLNGDRPGKADIEIERSLDNQWENGRRN